MTDSISAEAQEASPSRLARLKVPLGLALGRWPSCCWRGWRCRPKCRRRTGRGGSPGAGAFGVWPTWGLVAMVVVMVMLMSRMTSNTATAAAILVIPLVVFVLAMPVLGFGWSV